jgi:hypothetical protein
VFGYTDGTNWVVAKREMTSTYSAGVDAALVDEYGPTDLYVLNQTSSTCSDASHDTCVYDNTYGDNGLNGWNSCAGSGQIVGAHPNQVCTLSWVRLNQSASPPAKRIACHELGHSVGLRHTTSSTSCLRATADGGTSRPSTAMTARTSTGGTDAT